MPQVNAIGRSLARTRHALRVWWRLVAALAGGVMLVPATLSAHPHVFVTVEATVLFENGAISGIKHVWTFDEFYTAMAVEGLDTNKDGTFSRDELAELAKVNVEGLREFDYFTFATLSGQPLKLGVPKEGSYWLEHAKDVLSLHFVVPLATPVLSDAKGFQVSIYDQTYFIALELAKKADAVKLGEGAPKSCKIKVGISGEDTGDAKKLSDAFSSQLGGASSGGLTKTISVDCT